MSSMLTRDGGVMAGSMQFFISLAVTLSRVALYSPAGFHPEYPRSAIGWKIEKPASSRALHNLRFGSGKLLLSASSQLRHEPSRIFSDDGSESGATQVVLFQRGVSVILTRPSVQIFVSLSEPKLNIGASCPLILNVNFSCFLIILCRWRKTTVNHLT